MEAREGNGNDDSVKADIETRELIERVADELGRHARAEAVFGEPVERDGITVIPVAAASIGLGGGGGPAQESGEVGGVGAGIRLSPVGYIELGAGRARYRRILPTWAFVSIALGLGAFAGLLLFGRVR